MQCSKALKWATTLRQLTGIAHYITCPIAGALKEFVSSVIVENTKLPVLNDKWRPQMVLLKLSVIIILVTEHSVAEDAES